MKLFTRIAAGVGAVVFAATAMGLPDVSAYCTARTIAAAAAAPVAGIHRQDRSAHAVRVNSQQTVHQRVRLPI